MVQRKQKQKYNSKDANIPFWQKGYRVKKYLANGIFPFL
jgi:hypothetical protein